MRIFLIGALFLTFLFSCSKFEVGYQLAPRLISNSLDDAFDFKSQRLKEIKAQIAGDFKKNQHAVAGFLVKTSDALIALSEKKETTKDEFLAVLEKVKSEAEPVMGLFKGSFEIVTKNLSSDEAEYFNTYSVKKFKETDEKIADKEKYLKHQLKTFEKTMDFFFGSATSEQNDIYKNFFTENYDYFLAQHNSQKEFSKRFLVLQSKKDELLDYVLKYYRNDLSVRPEDYQKKYKVFEKSFGELEYNIWKSRTEKQQKYFKKTMTSLKDELVPLAQ